MLVYIRESDKDKIICNVDEKDIAEHLRVSCQPWFLAIEIYFSSLISPSAPRLDWKRTVKRRSAGKRRKLRPTYIPSLRCFESACWAYNMNCFSSSSFMYFHFVILHVCFFVQIARDDDLTAQIGKDTYFDLVDHDKVPSFRIQKQMPFTQFKVITLVKTVFAVLVLLAYFSHRNIEEGCCLQLVLVVSIKMMMM